MPYDCGACVAKYLLCLFNFIVFLAGSIVLGVGIWLAVDKNSFIVLMKVVDDENLKQFTEPTVIEQASYILIVAGAFMFIVSFLGYCGALRESQCLLTTYGICLVIILIMEITAGGLAAAYRGKVKETWTTISHVYEWLWTEGLLCVNYMTGIIALVVIIFVASTIAFGKRSQIIHDVGVRAWSVIVGTTIALITGLVATGVLILLIFWIVFVVVQIIAAVTIAMIMFFVCSAIFLAVSIIVFTAEQETRGFLKLTINKYYTTSDKRNAVTQVWNVMMKQLSCCGVDDSQDITESPGWKNSSSGQIIPIECCVWVNSTTVKDSNCIYSPSESNSYYKMGCYKTIINWIMQQINTVIIVAICLGIIQLLGIFLAFCLCKSIDGYIK